MAVGSASTFASRDEAQEKVENCWMLNSKELWKMSML